MSDKGIAARAAPAAVSTRQGINLAIILSLSTCHLLNDMMQGVLTAIYPVLKASHGLDFGQIGMITLAFQCTASLLQPVVGTITDRRPIPYSLPVGMASTFCGLLLLSRADTYPMILLAAALVGVGSSVFHPESSRVARAAAGGRYGLAQSIFQVGGNMGHAIGPLLAAFIVVPRGQASVVWFSAAALLAMAILARVSAWYSGHLNAAGAGRGGRPAADRTLPLSRGRTALTIGVLVVLMFSKNVYMASLGSFFTFYLIHNFDVSVQVSQFYLFGFLFGIVTGTVAGGAIGDKVGRVPVIWFSILGAAPFALALPYASLFWTAVLAVLIGAIMASAFSAMLVYAQDLMPGRVGMVAGLFFGFAFGLGGLGAAGLGVLADRIGIEAVYRIVSVLPLFGLFAIFLPNSLGRPRAPMPKPAARAA